MTIEKEAMRKKTYYFPEDLDDNLQNYSNKTGLSMSDIVRISVADYLRRHPLKIKKAAK